MVYFCADDYGISAESNRRIEECLKKGVLNKISVLSNGEISDFKQRFPMEDVTLSLHLNLIEGRPVSNPKDVDLLVDDKGFFKYSFSGLFFLTFSKDRKKIERQIYTEIRNQINFWRDLLKENSPIFIDSHQHTHLIPIVFENLMRVIKDEDIMVEGLRIPAEPVLPYILTPSMYLNYSPIGLLKQWILKILAFANRKEIKKSKIPSAYFMGVLFSGKLNEKKVEKLLPQYLKIAEKHNRNIEIVFHPGYLDSGETLIDGCRKSFYKFYFSPYRKTEFDALINLKLK